MYPHFDDFDDFNGLVKIDSVAGSAIFVTTVKVEYVNIASNVITVSATQTYNKRITVNVTSKWMGDSLTVSGKSAWVGDTLTFTNVMSYWFFR